MFTFLSTKTLKKRKLVKSINLLKKCFPARWRVVGHAPRRSMSGARAHEPRDPPRQHRSHHPHQVIDTTYRLPVTNYQLRATSDC